MLVVVLVASLAVLAFWGPDALKTTLSITGVGLTACLLWVVKGIRDWRLGVTDVDSSRLSSSAEQLGEAVHQMWKREAANRGITSPLTIDVNLTVADPRITAHSSQWLSRQTTELLGRFGGAGFSMPLGTATGMAKIYNQVRTGRMVIIGEPGGGKTAAAILLLLEIYKMRTPEARVPVFFQLAAWHADRDTLNDWMAEQLATTYGTPPILAKLLVEGDRILPLLDGLDEVPESGRREAITALRTLAEKPFVLTCRASEYTEAVANAVLEGAGVVEVTPSSSATAIRYLTLSGAADSSRWDSVIAALRASGTNPCKAALSSPLMLSLARAVFQAPSSQPSAMLTWRTVEEFQDRLLDGLVPAVYERTVADIRVDSALRALRFFADNLPSIGPGAVAWWRLPRCISTLRLRAIIGTLCGITGAVYSTVVFMPYLLNSGPGSIQAEVILIAGVTSSCLLAGATVNAHGRDPSYWTKPTVRQVVRSIAKGIAICVGFGILMVILFAAIILKFGMGDFSDPGQAVSQRFYLATVVVSFISFISAVAFLLVGAVMRPFSSTQLTDIDPISAFRGDLRSGLLAVVTGLAACVGAILAWLSVVIAGMTWVHLLFWALLVVGLLFMWFLSRYSTALPYATASLILHRQKALPARPLRFLEDAYKRGVLRKSGMTYEFRHARLAERLKSRPSDAAGEETAQA